jgi:hypothetical protein
MVSRFFPQLIRSSPLSVGPTGWRSSAVTQLFPERGCIQAASDVTGREGHSTSALLRRTPPERCCHGQRFHDYRQNGVVNDEWRDDASTANWEILWDARGSSREVWRESELAVYVMAL